MEKHRIVKATRTIIRLKHSLKADVEINAVLPDTLDEFETALANGELQTLKTGLADALGGDDALGA